ncbi:hypothetical protein, partial [Labilibaculum sp.]|uniref:hypothetical protein n=1 Tax=Labilibaculum sp. TaxID=2060723 RepID=UPI0035643EE8
MGFWAKLALKKSLKKICKFGIKFFIFATAFRGSNDCLAKEKIMNRSPLLVGGKRSGKFFENIGNKKLGKYKNRTLSIRNTITLILSMSRINKNFYTTK